MAEARSLAEGVIANPAVPVDRLIALVDDAELGPYAARNPALPIEVMHRIPDGAGVPREG